MWDLLPQALEHESLPEAVEGEVGRFAARGTEIANLEVSGEPITTPPELDAAMLRICQEALMNVRKYAHASLVDVALVYGTDSVTLRVRDNGAGFDQADLPASAGETGGGFGLTSMRQRAMLLGGTFEVNSERGGGTEITATIAVNERGNTFP